MSKRDEGLQKKALSLYLAASDMEQAIAAAEALDAESENLELMRALETAIAACYARPFTKGSMVDRLKASKWVSAGADRQLHDALMELRNQVYAHTDVSSGRKASTEQVTLSDGTVTTTYSEGWWAFPREWIPPLVKQCREQAQQFRAAAAKVEAELAAS
jgi:hypothetical protein